MNEFEKRLTKAFDALFEEACGIHLAPPPLTVTTTEVLAAYRRLLEVPDPPPLPRGATASLFGVPVYVHPWLEPVPNFELSKAVTVSDEYRREFDAWAREFFGTREVAYLINGGDVRNARLVMSQRSLTRIGGAT